MSYPEVHIVGGGLAGSEAAYWLAQRGIPTHLHEMRPQVSTPAHQSEHFAELVCSNSFKSQAPGSAPGMLKTEMALLGSLSLQIAQSVSIPGGEALSVDRHRFAQAMTQHISAHPLIQIDREEVTQAFPDAITLFATGPLTSEPLTRWLQGVTGVQDLYFYDAIAPIVEANSLDPAHYFLANRYDKGEEQAYLNCPLSESQYAQFIEALSRAQTVAPRNFEEEKFFQGCQPIEAIAAGGGQSLRFGPMKPVGLLDPRTGKRPYAVVQLRPENLSCSAYNLVGFQTKLKYGEQKRVLGLIPALARAEYLRLGSIHRNTYVRGPQVLRPDLSLRGHARVYLAGQLVGVEGYLESAACGLLAAQFIHQRLQGIAHRAPPPNTALGALLRHVVGSPPEKFSPSGIHFGLFEHHYFNLATSGTREELRAQMAAQAQESFSRWYGPSREAHSE